MYYVGIDISKYKHDCFIMDGNGVVIRDSFSINNSQEGFNTLLSELKHLDSSQEIKIGLEATGHYGSNLISFLNDNNFNVVVLNPLNVKNYIRSLSNRKEKNDKIDAMYIAKYIASPDHSFKSYQVPSYHLKKLKSLTRLRERLIKTRSQYLVEITNALDIVFPEFKDFFDGKLTDSALFILKKYKTRVRISKFTREDIIKCHNRFKRISIERLDDLKDLAKNSIGQDDEGSSFQLSTALAMYEAVDEHISNTESEIDSVISQIDSPIFSIKGIGDYSAAGILAEFGDINRFESPSQMVSFAGMDCSRYQSGISDYRGHMVKHGSPHLRYYLFNIVRPLKLHNEVFNTYYNKKCVVEKKGRRVAESHTIKKLIRVIFTLYHQLGEDGNLMKFDPLKLR